MTSHLEAGGRETYCKCGRLHKMTTLLGLAATGASANCACGKRLFKRLPQLKKTTFILLDGGPIEKRLSLDLTKPAETTPTDVFYCSHCKEPFEEVNPNAIIVGCRHCKKTTKIR